MLNSKSRHRFSEIPVSYIDLSKMPLNGTRSVSYSNSSGNSSSVSDLRSSMSALSTKGVFKQYTNIKETNAVNIFLTQVFTKTGIDEKFPLNYLLELPRHYTTVDKINDIFYKKYVFYVALSPKSNNNKNSYNTSIMQVHRKNVSSVFFALTKMTKQLKADHTVYIIFDSEKTMNFHLKL